MNKEKKFHAFGEVYSRHIQGLENPLMRLRNLMQRARAIAYQQITLRLPCDLAEALVEAAQNRGMSVNSFVMDILVKNVQKPKVKRVKLLDKILTNKELSASFLWYYYANEKQYINVPNFQKGTLKKVLLRSPSVLERVEKGEQYQKIIKLWWKKLPEKEKKLWGEVVELWGKVVYKSKRKVITTNAIAKVCLTMNLEEAKPKQLAEALGVTYGTAYKLMPLVLEFDDSTDYRVKEILASLQMLEEVPEEKFKGRYILAKTFPELNLEF